ncbi:flagellar motor switch protein FliM [Alkalispirochaeta sphaeroplastigenens]|uniref:Flagellar motor switch protein FliM n=1 Tax=Alkalispirochaeta sphaeroplastigenens TaxID=1187066 RepID=A0A2S4JYX3_9SPIO|nr:flagellar motor switch protein FliM [Alkalispirochaeta sphaeroplastigenens]POR04714.1 flagellar motor switch protein FliM [Alkalispirochaeta sphaeroplastigenens]
MNEVLSQDEIDQLLTAISSGDVDTDDFSQPTESRKIKIYDFKRPDKFSKEQIRTVSIMHETFARLTTTALSAQLRSLVQVHVASVDQLTYEEFIRSIPNPTTLGVINMDPLKGSAILEIDPAITFSIIDRLFGGQGEGTKVTRDLTDIETSVMEGIIVRILGNMREAWSQVIDLRPRLGQIETNPQFAQIVPPTEMVVLVTLETKVGEIEGMMNFCIPYLTIEPIISKLSAQYWYSSVRRGATTENLNILRERLSTIAVPLVVEIGSMDLTVRDVLSLAVGDVIRLQDSHIYDHMALRVGDRKKFWCKPGQIANKLAVQVTGRIEAIETEEFEELVAEEGE